MPQPLKTPFSDWTPNLLRSGSGIILLSLQRPYPLWSLLVSPEMKEACGDGLSLGNGKAGGHTDKFLKIF